jgi:hypothetical protein
MGHPGNHTEMGVVPIEGLTVDMDSINVKMRILAHGEKESSLVGVAVSNNQGV